VCGGGDYNEQGLWSGVSEDSGRAVGAPTRCDAERGGEPIFLRATATGCPRPAVAARFFIPEGFFENPLVRSSRLDGFQGPNDCRDHGGGRKMASKRSAGNALSSKIRARGRGFCVGAGGPVLAANLCAGRLRRMACRCPFGCTHRAQACTGHPPRQPLVEHHGGAHQSRAGIVVCARRSGRVTGGRDGPFPDLVRYGPWSAKCNRA